MKKRIAHSIYPYLFITGSWIYSQLIGIQKYESVVITDRKINTDIYPLDKVLSISESGIINKNTMKIYKKIFDSYSWFAYQLIKNQDISLIHSHFGDIGWQDTKIKKKLDIPQVTTFYGYDLSMLARMRKWKDRYKELFEVCDTFTVEGNYMKSSLVKLGCNDEKIQVQHLGIDLNRIKFKERLIDDDGIVKILAAGTFREKKGIPYAVEAFAIAKEKYKNLRLTIIGDANNPDELVVKRQIFSIIKKYGIENSVNIKGYQPYDVLMEEVQKHHIFISPSVQAASGDNEGGAPVSIIEMSASGMPIIATWHCDIPEVVIDGKSGFLVKERNVEEIVERIYYLVENPNIWSEMGTKGREHISRNYNLEYQIPKQCNIYENLL